MTGTGEARLRSLASMARALGRSERLETIVEMCAEEALRAVGAASVSISRLEAGTGLVRTLINVGDLGPTEERWPVNEIYRLQDFTQLRSVVESLRTWTYAVERQRHRPEGGRAAPRPGQVVRPGRPPRRRRRALG